MKEQAKYDALIRDGYCVFERILTDDMLDRVRRASDALLEAQEATHFETQKSTGSLISIYDDPFFSELVAWQPALDALGSLGFDRPRFSSGFVISKPAKSPPLFWHQDWWGWNDPHSYTPVPQQLFLMYYLVDTSPANGCLRLIPGSHLKRHAMHDTVPVAHTEELRRYDDPTHPAFQTLDDEVDVPVKAGDLVIGDSRLLHGAHANSTERRRTVITLWYHPVFDDLPEGMRAAMGRKSPEKARRVEHWSKEARARIEPLVPTYEGDAEPLEWNRDPGERLK